MALAFLLCGCIKAPPIPAPIQPILYRCIAVTSLTPQQQEEFLSEYQKLPAGGILRLALDDWYRMRQDARSCTTLQGD